MKDYFTFPDKILHVKEHYAGIKLKKSQGEIVDQCTMDMLIQ